jgi:inner membrane protein
LAIDHQLAAERGHEPLRLGAKPSFANIVVWKLVYETEQKFYVDAVRPGVLSERILTGRTWTGNSTDKLNLASDFLWLAPRSRQAKDVQRFGRFSSGYLGLDPQNNMGIVDIRYSLLPPQIARFWGIQLPETRGNGQYVHYFTR